MKVSIIPLDFRKEIIIQLRLLLLKDPFYFYSNYSKINQTKYIEYLIHEIEELNKKNLRNMILLAKKKDKIVGMITLKFANWDTSYFGISMAKIRYLKAIGSKEDMVEIKKALLGSLIQKCLEKRIKHLTIRIDLMDYTSLFVLEEMGFRVMTVEGVNILDNIEDRAISRKISSLKIRQMEEKDFDQLVDIGREVALILKSHYHFDLGLPRNKVQNYYVENVINCCKGNIADEVIVAEQQGRAVGFLAYKFSPTFTQIVNSSKASVVLFAISSSKRGKDISTIFLYEASKYILEQVDFIIGKVYLHNIGMTKLLAKFNSYPFCQYLYCLHKWL